jgi:hypothetical protein
MARRTPPRKVTYFEPVAPRLARNTVIESTFEVGRRFRCTMRIDCGQIDTGAVIRPVPGEWHSAYARAPMPPHTRRSWNGDACQSSATVWMPGAIEPLRHALADAVDVLQVEAQQNFRQVLLGDDDQPVRLLQIGADLAEKHVGRDADRAGEAFADLVAQPRA